MLGDSGRGTMLMLPILITLRDTGLGAAEQIAAEAVVCSLSSFSRTVILSCFPSMYSRSQDPETQDRFLSESKS